MLAEGRLPFRMAQDNRVRVDEHPVPAAGVRVIGRMEHGGPDYIAALEHRVRQHKPFVFLAVQPCSFPVDAVRRSGMADGVVVVATGSVRLVAGGIPHPVHAHVGVVEDVAVDLHIAGFPRLPGG